MLQFAVKVVTFCVDCYISRRNTWSSMSRFSEKTIAFNPLVHLHPHPFHSVIPEYNNVHTGMVKCNCKLMWKVYWKKCIRYLYDTNKSGGCLSSKCLIWRSSDACSMITSRKRSRYSPALERSAAISSIEHQPGTEMTNWRSQAVYSDETPFLTRKTSCMSVVAWGKLASHMVSSTQSSSRGDPKSLTWCYIRPIKTRSIKVEEWLRTISPTRILGHRRIVSSIKPHIEVRHVPTTEGPGTATEDCRPAPWQNRTVTTVYVLRSRLLWSLYHQGRPKRVEVIRSVQLHVLQSHSRRDRQLSANRLLH